MDETFGTWIKHRRKQLDLTQHELAARVGCSASAIFKIESGERRPSRQIAELLARHLEIPPEYHQLFLRIARRERAADSLESVPSLPVSRAGSIPNSRRSELPGPPTPLIGREHE